MATTLLSVNRLSDDISAAPQLRPADMAAVAAAGFRSVINNRPDFEGGPTQPTSAAIEAAAVAAGMAYAHLPVLPSAQSADEAKAMAALLVCMPHPLLMFCRSGARSVKLYTAATAA